MNRFIKQSLLRVGFASGYFAARRRLGADSFRIVTYHGVDPDQHDVVNFDRLQTHPDIFAGQIELFARHFKIMPLREAVGYYRDHGRWPVRGLAITFDDGYRNNLEYAAPILERAGAHATFFVTSGFIDKQLAPWWYLLREHLARQPESPVKQMIQRAIEQEDLLRPMNESHRASALARMSVPAEGTLRYPFLDRQQCRELLKRGFDVQCHSHNHISFAGETTERILQDIALSADFIRSVGHTPWSWAYPYGHEPKDVLNVRKGLQDQGILTAVTTRVLCNGRNADLFALGRYDLHGGYSPEAALARIS